MKLKGIILTAMCLMLFFNTQAQNKIKVGYTNVDYIISFMPEAKQIDSELKTYETQLSKQIESKLQEYQQKLKEFEQGQATMTEAVRNSKIQEIQSLESEIKKFQNDAQVSLQKKQGELLQPVYDKIQKAIDKVAKANGFTHIFSSDVSGFPVLLYVADDQENISNMVLKELGITPPSDKEEK